MQLQCLYANLTKFKKDVFLKNVACDLKMLLLLSVLKLYTIQVVISLPLWIRLTMDQLLLFFCETSATFLAYGRGVLGTKIFSQFVNDRYILTIQQIITH